MTETATSTNDAYIPGVCNINTAEQAQRRKAGYLGIAIFAVVLAIMLALSLNRWVRIILFAPAFLAAIGFLQSKHHFCVGYGAAGLQNASEGSDSATTVAEAAAAKDKQRARQINLQALVISIVATIAVLLIPVF